MSVHGVCTADCQLVHLRLQGGALHTEAGRGSVWPRHHPTGLPQGVADVFALDILQRAHARRFRRMPQLGERNLQHWAY